MAITEDRGRQTVLSAMVHFTYADFTSGSATAAVTLPGGAHVVSGQLVVTTAWNSATSAAIEVGDTSAVDSLMSSQDVKTAAGVWDITPYTGAYSAKEDITIELTEVGAATAGAGYLVINYVIDGRAVEVQPA